jgi:nicotinamide-nucleotide amidase
VSARLASVPGISDVLLGGIVAYQESIKQSLLGVSETVLAASGVVSAEVTDLMAEKVQKLFGSDVACAVSGFFGPTGGTEQAPVGTVCASFRLPHTVFSERFVFHGSRESICERTIQAMIARLILAMRQR